MPIDWFTVAAQAINFLILVWLLKRFLYKPILHAIDEREKGIASQLAEAEAKKADAQQDRDDFQRKNEAFDQERAALLKKVANEAATERQRLLNEARKDADLLRAKRKEALRNEQSNLSQEITRWTQKQVFAIARKTLEDLATTSLEERMCEAFIHRLRALSDAAKEQLAAALKSSPRVAHVESAFDLPPAQRSAIENAVKETFAADIQVQFETTPDLISGIELSANGQKVAWSIADYLATLAKSASELLHEDVKPESKPDTQPETEAKSNPGPIVVDKPGSPRELKQVFKPVPSVPKADH
jgi:F-type H+-transporting ATPase subunit b